MKRTAYGVAALAALFFVFGAMPARADPCPGASPFTDVPSSDPFCSHTEWLKNRAITTGCGGTLFCPNDFVTRGQMAAFLNRAALALTPRLVAQEGAIMAQTLPPLAFIPVCQTAQQASTNYPRMARARGFVRINATGPQLQMFLVYSINNGPFQSMNATFLHAISVNGERHLAWAGTPRTINPGEAVHFAIGIAADGTIGLSINSGACVIEAEIDNANPTTPPFDR